MSDFTKLLQRELATYEPRVLPTADRVAASVSVVFRDSGNGVELLLIQRAQNARDPWSGQIAFPGGKFEQTDSSFRVTAERETHEEVGLQLSRPDYIGQLDDLLGPTSTKVKTVHLSSFVYYLQCPSVLLKPNYEVAQVLWVPLTRLCDQCFEHQFSHPAVPSRTLRGIRLSDSEDELILWGLSLRVLYSLFQRLSVHLENGYDIFADMI